MKLETITVKGLHRIYDESYYYKNGFKLKRTLSVSTPSYKRGNTSSIIKRVSLHNIDDHLEL